jgi:hypothetical protein
VREVHSSNTRCQFGVARRDITAPVGIYARYWGAANQDTADGVHRPATVTASSISSIDGSGANRMVLVALDFGSFHPVTDGLSIRQEAMERAGLDDASLLINFSHCHAGANASTARLDHPGGDKIPEYLELLETQVVDAVTEAIASESPAWITWGYGRCSMATNRDFWDVDSSRYGCGFNPDTPADDTVLVGRVTGGDNELRAVLFNYACHPTTLAWDNTKLSPDYIGAAREVIENVTEAPALFFQGASGELGPRNGFVGDIEVADQNGRQLGFAVASTLESLPKPGTKQVFTGIVSSGADIATWAHVAMSDEELESASVLQSQVDYVDLECKYIPSAAELREQLSQETERPIAERLKRRLMIRDDLGEGDVYRMPIWSWRLGDAALVAIPNEPYSILQTSLRKAFAGHPVMVMGVTNSTLGYLCPAELYGTGRYQEIQSPFLPGCLELTAAGASRSLAKLFEAVPAGS